MEINGASLGAVGLAGAATWHIAEQYRASAPSLSELRAAPGDSTEHRQALMDTDVLTGTLAIATGVLAWFLTGSPWPLAIVAAVFLLVSTYHHQVLRGPSPQQIDGGSK